MPIRSASARLREEGVVLLRGGFARAVLAGLREAAVRCFDAIDAGISLPERYRFTPTSHSVQLTALLDFGCASESELLAPLAAAELEPIFCEALRGPWRCPLEHAWVRKKFGTGPRAGSAQNVQNWHQDGALGARFPLKPGPAIPMTELVTCWIPLQDCGSDSPGLEFVRQRQPGLLHFSELDDMELRGRFGADAFWAPTMELGDGLLFLGDALHRTHVQAGMEQDRISVEYRVFPQEGGTPLPD